jgi:hypothetical protein
MYSKFRIGKYLPDNFPIRNQLGLKLNETHQLLIYADDVNLLRDKIGTMKNNTQTLIDANKEDGLEENKEKN